MLSRIAEVMFWIGRYLERAENTARLLQVNYYAIAEAPVEGEGRELLDPRWARLLALTDNDEQFYLHYHGPSELSVIDWLTVSRENPASIWSSLASARENARTVRFHLNLEMWEAVNRTYNDMLVAGKAMSSTEGLSEYCLAMREASHLFFGIAEATLPRNESWHFMAAGRYLERVDNVLRLLDVQYGGGSAPDTADRVLADHRSRSFLRSVGAYEAYRKKHDVALDSQLIADFLLLDDTFPRSVRWSAMSLHQALEAIAHLNPAGSGEITRLSGFYAAQLQYLSGGSQVIRQRHPGLEELITAAAEIATKVDEAYFSHGGPDLLDSIPQQQQQQQ